MGRVRPSRVVYTRIGNQESWAGWTIAGYTPDAGSDVLNGCKMLQGRNSNAAKMMYDRINPNTERNDIKADESAKVVYEFFGEYNDSINCGFSFTKIKFGVMDESDSPGMYSTSIVCPNTDNWDIVRNPQKLLRIDRSCFSDCELNRSQLEAARGRNDFSKDSLHTSFIPKEYEYDDFSIEEAVSEIFSNKKIYTDLIMCVYWNLTYKSSSSIYIQIDNDLDKCIKLFLIVFNSVIYSYRTKLSFRTYDFEDATNQPTIVFCREIPYGARLFDIKTGTNNILTEATTRKLNKQSFVYYPSNLGSKNVEKYFDLLDEKLNIFGNRNSHNIADLEAASMLVQDELNDVSLQTNRDLLMRLLTFCNLPISNQEMDMHIAMILETILERNIPVNEDICKHIEKKLALSTCEKLADVGIKWHAQSILANNTKEKSFETLKGIRENDKNYVKIIKYILTQENGKEFVDEFYSTVIGPEYIVSSQTILKFSDETKLFGDFPKTKQFIAEKCVELGKVICVDFYNTNESLIDNMESFMALVAEVFNGDYKYVNPILEKVKVFFWTELSISKYAFDNIPSYKYMVCSDPRKYNSEVVRKCNFLLSISETFKMAEKQNVNTVRAFRNKLKEYRISASDGKSLILQFQKYCLTNCNKSYSFDFWFVLSELNTRTQCEFLFKNRIPFFVDEELYKRSIEVSEELNRIEKIDSFIAALEEYLDYSDSKIVSMILDITKDYKRKLKKLADKKRKDPNVKRSNLIDIWSQSKNSDSRTHMQTDDEQANSGKIVNAISAVKKRILGKK